MSVPRSRQMGIVDRDHRVIHAEVTSTENARGVGNDGDVRLILAQPVLQDLADIALDLN